MGYRLLCPPHVLDTVCQLWYRHRELPLPERLLVRHGMALTVTILRRVQGEDDDQSLLQVPRLPARKHIELVPLLDAPVITQVDFREVVSLRDDLLNDDLGVLLGRGSVVKWHTATGLEFALGGRREGGKQL